MDQEPESRTPRQRFGGGARVGLRLAFPTLLLALTFGATTHQLGWGVLAPVVASAVVFSGSAQFALATALGSGGGVLTAVLAAALINARFAPMSVAVAPSLRGNRLRRAAEGQAVVDGSFVAAHLGDGRFDRERMMGATAVQYVAWVSGTVLGVLLAPPAILGERELPARATGVIALLAAALLTGLVVVDVLGPHWDAVGWPLITGLVAVVIARWRGVPEILSIVIGVVVTALLRLSH